MKREYEKIDRHIPVENSIASYMHCKKCLEEKPEGVSPKEFSQTQTGFTKLGIQIWCNRHECNVAHIDLQNFQFPAA